MKSFLQSERAVILFTAAYLATAVGGAVRGRNLEFVLYIGVIVVLAPAILWLHSRVQLRIAALWGLSWWGAVHMAGGLVHVPTSWPTAGSQPVLYNLWLIPDWLKFDQIVHVYGFGLVTWVCWQGISQAFSQNGVSVRPTFGLLTLCGAAGMGFGALNEVVEFMATQLFAETNVGGYVNTGWDLVANLAGCVIAAVGIAVGHRPVEVDRNAMPENSSTDAD